jgi:rhodanese-related sulfurtransferase
MPEAINVPLDQLLAGLTPAIDHEATIVTVCNLGGARSQRAAERFRELGWSSARQLCGGLAAWRASAAPGHEADRGEANAAGKE